MNVTVLGGGPAGLFFAILMKKQDPAHEITVIERDGPDDTFGWGIVLSDRTLAFLERQRRGHVCRHRARCHDLGQRRRGSQGRDGVHPRQRLLRHRAPRLSQPASAAGPGARRGRPLSHRGRRPRPPPRLRPAPGADGANSLVRRTWSDFFQPSVDVRRNRYIWLGTEQLFHGLVMIFREAPAGLFIAHAYKFSPTTSTFIVECGPEAWTRAGFQQHVRGRDLPLPRAGIRGRPRRASRCSPIASSGGSTSRSSATGGGTTGTSPSPATPPTPRTSRSARAPSWRSRMPSRSPAPSPSSGTVAAALPAYERARQPVVDAFQAAALKSLAWLEHVEPHLGLDPIPFAYKHMMRSQRIGYARLRQMDPALRRALRSLARRARVRRPDPARLPRSLRQAEHRAPGDAHGRRQRRR